MESSPLPCYLVTLRLKYPPQHSIPEHPQPRFFPRSSLFPRLRHTKESVQVRSSCDCFVTRSSCLERGAVSTSPKPQAELPIVGCQRLLIEYIRS